MAQAPRLALSRIGRSEGSRTAAFAALMPVLTVQTRSDPWWGYYFARQDETDPLLDQWRASVPPPARR